MEPAVINPRKERHTPVQNLKVINKFGSDAVKQVVNPINYMLAVSGIVGIQRVRVQP